MCPVTLTAVKLRWALQSMLKINHRHTPVKQVFRRIIIYILKILLPIPSQMSGWIMSLHQPAKWGNKRIKVPELMNWITAANLKLCFFQHSGRHSSNSSQSYWPELDYRSQLGSKESTPQPISDREWWAENTRNVTPYDYKPHSQDGSVYTLCHAYRCYLWQNLIRSGILLG